MKHIKRCFVPSCNNNSKQDLDKLFFYVPSALTTRTQWCKAVQMENVPKGRCYYCCEDHFDLKEDSKNWFQWSFMPGSIRLSLKNNVVPHKNLIPIKLFLDGTRGEFHDILKSIMFKPRYII